MPVPADRHYTAEHEWIQVDGDVARIGITQYAADALGDVVYLELPSVGSKLTAGTPCGEVESTKSVSDLYAPVDGEVLEINDAVVAEPGTINTDPYDGGWLFLIRTTQIDGLLDPAGYEALTDGS